MPLFWIEMETSHGVFGYLAFVWLFSNVIRRMYPLVVEERKWQSIDSKSFHCPGSELSEGRFVLNVQH